jgi:hypothetical protein
MLRTRPIRRFCNDLDKSLTVDDYFDLVVWYEPSGEVHGFQLSYDRWENPRAVTWTRERGFSHCIVRTSGSTGIGLGMSPVLEASAEFPWRAVLQEFTARSKDLDPAIRNLVSHQIAAHASKYPDHTP